MALVDQVQLMTVAGQLLLLSVRVCPPTVFLAFLPRWVEASVGDRKHSCSLRCNNAISIDQGKVQERMHPAAARNADMLAACLQVLAAN